MLSLAYQLFKQGAILPDDDIHREFLFKFFVASVHQMLRQFGGLDQAVHLCGTGIDIIHREQEAVFFILHQP